MITTKRITVKDLNVLSHTNLNGNTTSHNELGQNMPSANSAEVLFITSYPPRQCGIATYTADLILAINTQFNQIYNCQICALESNAEQHNYTQAPKFILNTDKKNAFIKTAFLINKDEEIKLVVIQHEFGFYASHPDGFMQMLQSITKPIIIVFHTVLPNPSPEHLAMVRYMASMASAIVVMTTHASKILSADYLVDASQITIISHGTHLVPPLDKEKIKHQYKLGNKKILSTFGLLSSSKSIETTLKALPEVIKKYPDVLFLILGKTHPTVAKHQGEVYRDMLKDMVANLQLQNHVRFVNQYLHLPILLEYLQLTDIYLFTSKDPHQAVSGTFSYALSCGCPVISTPIPHALEVLSHDNGIIFDFENAEQLSTAIINLLDNEILRQKISLASFHKMASTAWQNSAIAHTQLFKKITNDTLSTTFKIPDINLHHIHKLTTSFGMLQFSKLSIPDTQSGYTLDDNARALIAICEHYALYHDFINLEFIKIYLNLIQYCQQPNGGFQNYINIQKQFTAQNNQENLDDSNGRAIWALGFVISKKNILPIEISNQAQDILQKAIPNISSIHSTRAMAFIIKGLYYQNNPKNLPLITLFANRLLAMYAHECTPNWHWYESYLTYSNSLLPEAMLCAYLSTKNPAYKLVALSSFAFLLDKIFTKNTIKVISNKGWLYKSDPIKNVVGGEQPIDVAYTILALQLFYDVFKEQIYLQKATTAFNWFLGNNHLQQIVYNPCTGGCYDGIESYNINLNQGAESSVCYLLARLAIQKILAKANTVKPLAKMIESASIMV